MCSGWTSATAQVDAEKVPHELSFVLGASAAFGHRALSAGTLDSNDGKRLIIMNIINNRNSLAALVALGTISLASTAMAGGVSWSYFGGGDAGFNGLTNNGALERAVAEGRIGNNAMNGTWERGIWQQGGVGSPVADGQYVWGNGSANEWEFNWDGVSQVTFIVGGQILQWNGVAGDFTDIFIRTRSAADSTLSLNSMNFDGADGNINPGDLISSGSGTVNYLRITNGGATLGAFSLSGIAELSWTGTQPTNSALAFQVKFTNVIPAPGGIVLLGAAGLLTRRRR